jgi:peptidoglycan hydrolase-like protein with peptidoglycan-binding domain
LLGEKNHLKRGSEGNEVASLQKQLTNLGYDLGEVDGKYGAKTLEAVRKFQSDFHLQSDGIVGGTTGAALEHYHKQKIEELAQQKQAPVAKSVGIKAGMKATPGKGAPAKGAPTKGAPAKGAAPAAKGVSVKATAEKGGGITGFKKEEKKGGLTGFKKD